MAKTYQDLVAEARDLLQDSDTDIQRYTDTFLIRILNRGLQEIARIRPDAFFNAYTFNTLNVPEVVETGAGAGQVDWTDTFGYDMQFYNRLVDFVVAVSEVTNDEFTEDGRAAALYQQFRSGLLVA